MSDVKALVQRLDGPARGVLERAAASCNGRGQATVELEHLLLELVAEEEVSALMHRFDVTPERVRADLERAIEGFRTVRSGTPALSTHLLQTLKEAWSLTSLEGGAVRVRPAMLFRAALSADTPRRLVLAAVPQLARIPADALSAEIPGSGSDPYPGNNPAAGGSGEGDALATYSTDLTEEARQGVTDPVVGREREVRQLTGILLRRRQNNPMLTGDAGVGKTAVVEGLARMIVAGGVPDALRDVRLLSLDLAALQAGAGVRGEFEERLRGVIEAVAASPRPVVLFIDEAHLLIGAGGTAGQGDAANLLKPALARGAFRCIGATTWAEYKKHIEKDPALARRFEVVKVAEPEPEVAVAMLRGIAARLEAHHGVRILENGLAEAVRLTRRYISGRQLPDKAISVLDTACAQVAISQSEAPPALADARARIAAIDAETARLARERALADNGRAEREAALAEERTAWSDVASALEARWLNERETVAALLALDPAAADPSEFHYLSLKLETLQEAGEPLVRPHVDGRSVAQVVSAQTGVPTGEMLRAGAENAQTLFGRLRERVVAQDGALAIIARRVQTYFAQLGEPGKPTGVFLLTGPSGVGKTETAITLAEMLFGGRAALVTINMSEYQEAHSISGLKGAPPGYVGYGRGGLLTEAVRRRPYSVVLLDEIEKAHRDVIELFYQVFDKGVIEDSEGTMVDFRNAMVILTSNVADEAIAAAAAHGLTDPADLAAAIRPELLSAFPAAFLGRLTVAPFLPLGSSELGRIAAMKLEQLRDRMAGAHRVALTWDRRVLDALVARATETESGARNIEAIIADALTPQVADCLLRRLAAAEPVQSVHIALDDRGRFLLDSR